jgi:hypothetical protein
MHTTIEFHVPTRPCSPIDSLNRRAAAVGSVRYAQVSARANYNGHGVTVEFNSHRRYYTAEYYWAERHVIERGTFIECLRAALRYYDEGALGASVSVIVPAEHADALKACESEPRLDRGPLPRDPAWYTWQHECAAAAARDSANPRSPVMHFDWELMQASSDRAAYEAALRNKYGRVWV